MAGPLSEGPCNSMENMFSTDSIRVQPKEPVEFYSGDCALGKVGYPDILRTVGQRVDGVYRDKVINGVLVKVSLIVVHWVCKPTPWPLSGPNCRSALSCLLNEVTPT